MVKHCWYYISEHGVKINGLKVILKMEGGKEEQNFFVYKLALTC